jgi:hypothetical protein
MAILQQAFTEQIGVAITPYTPATRYERWMTDCINAIKPAFPLTLVIDSIDYLDASSARPILAALIDHLSDTGCQIILNGREYPAELLQEDFIRTRVQLVPTDSVEYPDYLNFPTGKLLLEVQAFGVGQIRLNGRSIQSWEGVAPRYLLFFLVDQRSSDRTQIFQSFWPNFQLREATNVFHVTKRKMHSTLGADIVIYEDRRYGIAPSVEVVYDVSQFLDMAEKGFATDGEAGIPFLEKAISFYRQDYLLSLEVQWAVRRRIELQDRLNDTLVTLAQRYEAIGNVERLKRLASQAKIAQNRRDSVE